MKSALAIAAIAIICAAGDPFADPVGMPLARCASSFFAPALVAAQNTDEVWNGNWQGTTASGHPLVLQLQVQGQRVTGRLVVGKQSANIIEGKVEGEAFTLTTGPIDGRKVNATGRHVGEAIELTVEGAKEPLTLTRVK